MVADGRGLVFISHKIREVLELSDRITVLRDGRKVGTVLPASVSPHELAEMMVGHELSSEESQAASAGGEVRLAVRDLHVIGDRGTEAVRGLSLEVRSGEIVAHRRRLGERAARARRGDRGPAAARRRARSG